jgi:hypothetical protein
MLKFNEFTPNLGLKEVCHGKMPGMQGIKKGKILV